VELSPPDDRTGTGLGLDLDSLVRARLEGRVSLATSGPRLTVTSTVASLGTRLVWSARVVEEPAAALADVISVSAPWDPALLPLVPSRAGSGAEGVDVLDRSTTPPIEGRIVALAFLGDERLLVLFEDALALYRRDGLLLRLESRRDLPGPLAGVRFPGGVLLAAESESACWALTSRTPRAVLYSLDGHRLTPTHQADVVPWPRVAAGVTFDSKAGVGTDEHRRTSVPHIYAAGDVAGYWQLAHTSFREGEVAAENATGHEAVMRDGAAVPRPIYTDPEIAGVGLTEAEAVERYGAENIAVGRFPWVANARAVMTGETAGWVKSIHETTYGELVGVVIVGQHATDLIEAAVVALDAEATIETVADGMTAHPTLSEAIKEAGLVALGRPIHVATRKRTAAKA